MKILVIDAQGGGLGKKIISEIKKELPDNQITAVGSNAVATANMLKAGADFGATGENAVVVGCRTADVIVGPIGVAIADSMCGEITPKMALAVGQSTAKKLLIPMSHCDNVIVGLGECSVGDLVKSLMEELKKIGS